MCSRCQIKPATAARKVRPGFLQRINYNLERVGQSLVRAIVVAMAAGGMLLLAACDQLAGTAPAAVTAAATAVPASPAPFGTAFQLPTTRAATATPAAASRGTVCAFPITLADGSAYEAARYHFVWKQGITTQQLNTRAGTLQLEGQVTIAAGERSVVILHRADTAATLEVTDLWPPGSTLLIDPLTGASETRRADGTIARQLLLDAIGDTRGMPAYLDIASVDRQFDAAGSFILRITTNTAHEGKFIWSFQELEIGIGEERIVQRTLSSGKQLNLYYPTKGKYSDYTGTVVVQANTVTWPLQAGGLLPFAARSATSAAAVDQTAAYPADLFSRLWELAAASCG